MPGRIRELPGTVVSGAPKRQAQGQARGLVGVLAYAQGGPTGVFSAFGGTAAPATASPVLALASGIALDDSIDLAGFGERRPDLPLRVQRRRGAPMQSSRLASRPSDRFAWRWLALGAILLPFAHIQTVWPIAAWLYPVFLMRFGRTQRLAIGLPLIVLAQCLGAAIGMRNDYTRLPIGPLLGGAALAYGLVFSLPFVADRLLAARLSGALRILVYPLAAVTIDYLLLYTPFNTFGSPAYTQYGDLPLMQVVSLTGIWGLTFLISWLAPVVNEVWETGASPRVLRYGVLPFVLVFAGVLVYGSARLTFTPSAPVVRVAGLTPDSTLYAWPPIVDVAASSDAERATLRPKFMQIVDDLLIRSRQEARAGAKIMTWAEESAIILKEDEPAVLDQARALAREEGVYLQVDLEVIRHTDQFPFAENRAVMIDPAGSLVWDYHKAYPVPNLDGLEVAPGPAVMPVTQTPYGPLAGVICYDLDWVPYSRQAGLAQVVLLLAGANDWPAVEDDHANMAVYRAVENGFSVMRPTSNGLSRAVDPLGRELTRGEYFSTDRLAIVASVPLLALPTLYSRAGDVFAYVSIIVVIVLTVLAFAPWLRRQHVSGMPAPAQAR